MKQMIVMMLTGIVCCCGQVSVMAQYLPEPISPYRIEIGYDKTSNLIFPSSIKSVDRGSSAVLAQKAPGVENILQLKAGDQNFKETNVTVVTADGHFYSFEVSYNNAPATINFSFVGDSSEKAIVKDQPVSEASFIRTANSIESKRYSLHKRVWEQKVELSLLNIFMSDDLLWVELRITDQSLLPFTPVYARFLLQDKKESKRTAMQEVELTPVYHSQFERVEKGKSQLWVFAFRPFAVPSAKGLLIQVSETIGGRTLSLHLNHRMMQKAKSL